MESVVRKVAPVTDDESPGAAITRRREALGYFDRKDFAPVVPVSLNTLRKAELNDPTVEEKTLRRINNKLDQLERLNSSDKPEEIVNTIEVELPDGRTVRTRFTGSPEGVAEATVRFFEKWSGKASETP